MKNIFGQVKLANEIEFFSFWGGESTNDSRITNKIRRKIKKT